MKLMITGATGFVGQHLVKALASKGHTVVCATRASSNLKPLEELGQPLEFVDIQDSTALKNSLIGCECLVHLAGQLGKYGTPYETFYATNVLLTQQLLELCESARVPQFLYCSTPGVYGFTGRLCREDQPYSPRNDYEKTKMEAEKATIAFCENHLLQYTILRPDFVYGPGDTRRVKMYTGIEKKRFVLTTSGKSFLHPTYIDDVVQGIELSIANPKAYGQAFNIAAAKDITARQYLETIAKHTDSRLVHINIGYPLSIIAASCIDWLMQRLFHREGFVSKNKIDFLALDHSTSIEKARDLLGYSPNFDCDEGIRRTIAWCRKEQLM